MLFVKYWQPQAEDLVSELEAEPFMEVIAAVEKFADALIIVLRGRLDLFHAPVLMREFNSFLEEGTRHFIVDLTAVRDVDADGDYPLLHLLKCAQEDGGSVTLICPPGNPLRISYELLRLDTLFDMVETLDAALTQYKLNVRANLY